MNSTDISAGYGQLCHIYAGTSARVRILHVFPDTARAGWTMGVIEGLCGAQSDAGHSVEVVATNAGRDVHPEIPSDAPGASVQVLYFPVATSLSRLGIRILDNFTVSPQLNHWLSRNVRRFDIVHIYSVYALTSLAAGRACRRHRIPYVVSPVGNLDRLLGKRSRRLKDLHLALAGRRLLEGASVVHLMSLGESELIGPYGIRAPQAVIGFGLDLAKYGASRTPKGTYFRGNGRPLTITFLGRIAPSKGLDLLVRAFERVVRWREDVRLILIGPDEGGYAVELAAMQSSQAAINTTFTGFVPEEVKLAAIASCDLFVMPSYTEAFGIALLEAMASRTPVVVTDRAALAGEIAKAGAGLVVESSASSLAAAIQELLDDADRRYQLAMAGHRFVEANFGWQKIAPEFLDLYRSCIRRHNGTARPGVAPS